MQGERIDSAVVLEARRLREEQGLSFQNIYQAFQDTPPSAWDPSLACKALPGDASVIYRWSKKEGWGTKGSVTPKPPGPNRFISGVTDPILHLSRIRATREVDEVMKAHIKSPSLPSWKDILTQVVHALVG